MLPWAGRTLALLSLSFLLAGCPAIPPGNGSRHESVVHVLGACVYMPLPQPNVFQLTSGLRCADGPASTKKMSLDDARQSLPVADRAGLLDGSDLILVACGNGPGMRGIGNPAPPDLGAQGILLGGRSLSVERIGSTCRSVPGLPSHGGFPSPLSMGRSAQADPPSADGIQCGPDEYGPTANGHSPGYFQLKAYWKITWESVEKKNVLDTVEGVISGPWPKDSEQAKLNAEYKKLYEEAEIIYPGQLDADQAATDADLADAAARQAGRVAVASGNASALQDYYLAAAAAERGRVAAGEAADWMNKAQETNDPAAKQEDVDKSRAASARAADERNKAEKSLKDAEEKAGVQPPGGVTAPPGDGGQRPGAEASSFEQCNDMRKFIADCSSSGWNAAPCAIWLARLRGCDVTVIDPGPDGQACLSAGYTDADLAAGLAKQCVAPRALYEPGTFPGCVYHFDNRSAFVGLPYSCDPTKADGADWGCHPGEKNPVWSSKPLSYCPPQLPYTPVLPCIQLNPPPGPGPK